MKVWFRSTSEPLSRPKVWTLKISHRWRRMKWWHVLTERCLRLRITNRCSFLSLCCLIGPHSWSLWTLSASRHTLPTNISKLKKIEIGESLSFILFRHPRRKWCKCQRCWETIERCITAVGSRDSPSKKFRQSFSALNSVSERELSWHIMEDFRMDYRLSPALFFPLLKRALDCSCIEKTAAASFIILV